MISSLDIKGFRCFDHLEARDLARVNLLVGTNNCGKTSLLEAIELWASQGRPKVLQESLTRRGEYAQRSDIDEDDGDTVTVRHMFHGHTLDPGLSFEITANKNSIPHKLSATISLERDVDRASKHLGMVQTTLFDEVDAGEHVLDREPFDTDEPLALIMFYEDDTLVSSRRYQIGSHGRLESRMSYGSGIKTSTPARFIATRSLSSDKVAALYGEFMLTSEEPRIIRALQIIEPTIERLAPVPLSSSVRHAGMFIKCRGQDERIPIGSMGDGIWRMLSLVLGMVSVRGGILLVDEIDTGLHFSVMADMWKLVIEAAQQLDVQVFATSHSHDCYESLAVVVRELSPPEGTAAIHRIERDRGRTVTFDEQAIMIAAERGVEVR